MSNMILASALLSDAATIAGSSVAAGLPIDNLQRSAIGAVTRFLSPEGCYITADMGSPVVIDLVALLGHTATPAGQARVRASNILANVESAPSYDSGQLQMQSHQEDFIHQGEIVNYLRQSQLYGNAWTLTRVSLTPEAEFAPDGTFTASKCVVDTTAAATHNMFEAVIPLPTNGIATYSRYVKAAEISVLHIRLMSDSNTANYCRGVFDLATGTVYAQDNIGAATGATGMIENVGNGWYRCSISGTPDPVDNVVRVVAYIVDVLGTNVTWTVGTADGTSGMYIWGDQVELAATAGRYVKTGDTSVASAEGFYAPFGTDATDGTLPKNNFILNLSVEMKYRYWRIDMADAASAYLDVGRLYIANSFSPDTNMSYGLQEGFIDPSTAARAASGRVIPNEKPVYRVVEFELKFATEQETFGEMFDLDRWCGQTKDVLFIQDPSNKKLLQKRTIYGNMRSLSPNSNTSFQRFEKNYRVEEIIA